MSLWVFQDPSLNNYIIYINGINNTKYSVMKSGPLGTPIEWNYIEETGQTIQRVVGVADVSGTVFVAYQRADSRIVVASISADGGTRLWSVSYLPDIVIGAFTQPALTVVGDILILSCVGGSSSQVQVLKLQKSNGTIIWTQQLESSAVALTPVSAISNGTVSTVYMTGESSGVLTNLNSNTGDVSWSRSFPDIPPPAPPCFLAGTPVRMADGTWQEIQKLSPGDRLWTNKGPRKMLELLKKEIQPNPSYFPYMFPEGLMGAITTFAISPAHKIILKNGSAVYPSDLGLWQIPMTSEWIYYNIRMPAREHICVAGVVVESCPPIMRSLISNYQLQELIRSSGRILCEVTIARILQICRVHKISDEILLDVQLIEKEYLN